jgi:hypothetical protein
MISLILRASDTAKSQSSKRITAQHLKASLADDKQFDFLAEVCAEVGDEDKGGNAAAAKADDSDDEMGEGKKRRKGAKAGAGSKKKARGSSSEGSD